MLIYSSHELSHTKQEKQKKKFGKRVERYHRDFNKMSMKIKREKGEKN
jgi:hypothetical protein